MLGAWACLLQPLEAPPSVAGDARRSSSVIIWRAPAFGACTWTPLKGALRSDACIRERAESPQTVQIILNQTVQIRRQVLRPRSGASQNGSSNPDQGAPCGPSNE